MLWIRVKLEPKKGNKNNKQTFINYCKNITFIFQIKYYYIKYKKCNFYFFSTKNPFENEIDLADFIDFCDFNVLSGCLVLVLVFTNTSFVP